jgi:beta-phosphoglucomutase-like phosphatase (HAD superfamily)
MCQHLGIEMHKHHEVVGIDKAAAKQEIRALKLRREEILASDDKSELPGVRQRINRLKGRLRRAAV